MITFLTVFVVAMTYINARFKAENPLEQPLEVKASELSDEIEEQIAWTVYRAKIKVTSTNTTSQYPFKVYYSFPSNVDEHSISILNSSKKNIASQSNKTSGEVVWLDSLSSTNTFYMVFTRNANLSSLSYDSNLVNNSASINNSLLNISFSNGGITSLKYKNYELLNNGINFSFGSFATNKGFVAARAYASSAEVEVYHNMSKMLFIFDSATNVNINLTDSLTTQYNGSIRTFNDSTQDGIEVTEITHNGAANMTDIYDNTYGIAVIGDNLNTKITNNADEKQVSLTGVTEFILYMHDGSYTNALVERDLYLLQPTILLGVPEELKGVSEQKFQNFSKLDKTKRKEMLGTESLDFLLTIEGL